VVLIVTFRPEFEAPWIGRPYVTCLTINRLAAREVGAMIDGVIGNKLLAPNMRLASQPSEKGPKQQLGINAVRLCAAHPTINRHAGRLDNLHFHPMPHKLAVSFQ
jgi:hypothetical protein